MKPRIRAACQGLSTALILAAVLVSAPSAASANYFNDIYKGLEKFSELPSDVSELQESYKETMNELGETKESLDQTRSELNEARTEMETYRNQNAELQEQNRQLTAMIGELRDDRAARENYIHRLKVTVFTGLGLIAGYFILIRLVRFGMRGRSRRGDRIR
ncbi:hypothetical protein F4V43_09110 [Paenibacillus spiritus]|uniref:DUF3450 domain-containing protein n=1 Tax=Paenibacillus spiritus TaxID=2496557 RepID=A0A5J5G9C5_9BACL|nr:hypothetical protein [Paenibacillus spiritus]KAA9004789.1 hypothetical protein F4V43_09110 [Paenibacillus spiritus]